MAITENQYDELADLVSRLRAENARLREAVKRAAAQFSYYAELHALKPDPVKAASNQKWSDEMVAALKEGGGE
jgi:molecular chaperone GrpE (heat shock protein)